MTSTPVDKQSYEEKFRSFADSQTDPEKRQLYNGVASLIEAVTHTQLEVGDVASDVQGLDQRLRRIEDLLRRIEQHLS